MHNQKAWFINNKTFFLTACHCSRLFKNIVNNTNRAVYFFKLCYKSSLGVMMNLHTFTLLKADVYSYIVFPSWVAYDFRSSADLAWVRMWLTSSVMWGEWRFCGARWDNWHKMFTSAHKMTLDNVRMLRKRPLLHYIMFFIKYCTKINCNSNACHLLLTTWVVSHTRPPWNHTYSIPYSTSSS